MGEIAGDRLIRIQKILWIVFLVSTLFYAAAAFSIVSFRSGGRPVIESLQTIRLALIALATAEWIAAFWLRRWLLVRAFQESPIRWPAVQGAFVVGWAIQESIALIALVWVLLGGAVHEALFACAAAFVGILLMPPAPGWLLSRLAEETGSGGRTKPA